MEPASPVPHGAPPSPRERRATATRDRILDAAATLVAEVGVDAFSLRELARRVDYTPGALYRHFDSRDAILHELGFRALHRLGEHLARVPAALSPPERAVELGMAYLRFADEHPDDYTLAFDGLRGAALSWQQWVAVAWPFTLLVETFRQGVEGGAFEPRAALDAAGMAYGLWSLANGGAALGRRHLAGVTDNLRPMQRAALSSYVRGLSRRT